MKDYKNNLDNSQHIHWSKKFHIYFRSIIFQSVAIASLSLMVFGFQNCAKKSSSNVGTASSSSTANPTNTSDTTNSNSGTNNLTSGYSDANSSGSNIGITTNANTNTNTGNISNSTNTTSGINTGANSGSTSGSNSGAVSNSGTGTNSGSGTTASTSYSISAVHRYYNSASIDYIFSLDKIISTQIPNGYSYQGTGFYVYDRNSFAISELSTKKMLQLRACLYMGSKPYHFTEVSNSSSFKCSDLGAGFSDEGLFGYLSQQQLSNSAPLYRCYWSGLTHLTTPNLNECVQLDSNKMPIANSNGVGFKIMPYCSATVSTNCVDILGYAPTY